MRFRRRVRSSSLRWTNRSPLRSFHGIAQRHLADRRHVLRRRDAGAPVDRVVALDDRLAVAGQVVGDAQARRDVEEADAGIGAEEVHRRQQVGNDRVGAARSTPAPRRPGSRRARRRSPSACRACRSPAGSHRSAMSERSVLLSRYRSASTGTPLRKRARARPPRMAREADRVVAIADAELGGVIAAEHAGQEVVGVGAQLESAAGGCRSSGSSGRSCWSPGRSSPARRSARPRGSRAGSRRSAC